MSRLPIIPGYNNSLPDAQGFVRCLKEAGANRAQLLPFHQFGEGKYQALGRNYAYAGEAPLHEEDLEEFRQAFVKRGIEAFF